MMTRAAYLNTAIHGQLPGPITCSWKIKIDDIGTYIVPFEPSRHLVSPDKGFIGIELRLYFDLDKVEADPTGQQDHCFLRSGLDVGDAKKTAISLSDDDQCSV